MWWLSDPSSALGNFQKKVQACPILPGHFLPAFISLSLSIPIQKLWLALSYYHRCVETKFYKFWDTQRKRKPDHPEEPPPFSDLRAEAQSVGNHSRSPWLNKGWSSRVNLECESLESQFRCWRQRSVTVEPRKMNENFMAHSIKS